MSCPVLQPLPSAAGLPSVAAIPSPVRQDLRWFRVSQPGRYQGEWFDRGDLVGCALVAPPTCGRVVLEPVGRGAISLGRVRGRELFGGFDEPCSAIRWRIVGPIAVVVRRAAPAHASVAAESCGVRPQGGQGNPERRGRRGTMEPILAMSDQLPLFSRAA